MSDQSSPKAFNCALLSSINGLICFIAWAIVRRALLTIRPTTLTEQSASQASYVGPAHLFKKGGVMLMTTVSFITSNVKRSGNAKNSSLRPADIHVSASSG